MQKSNNPIVKYHHRKKKGLQLRLSYPTRRNQKAKRPAFHGSLRWRCVSYYNPLTLDLLMHPIRLDSYSFTRFLHDQASAFPSPWPDSFSDLSVRYYHSFTNTDTSRFPVVNVLPYQQILVVPKSARFAPSSFPRTLFPPPARQGYLPGDMMTILRNIQTV